MSYIDELRQVVLVHRAEIERDLEASRYALRRSRDELGEIELRAIRLEALLLLGTEHDADDRSNGSGGGLTLHEAMVEVLRQQPEKKLRPVDLAREINRRGLYRMRDGRPVETQQIHARAGNYGDRFVRKGPFIALVEGQ